MKFYLKYLGLAGDLKKIVQHENCNTVNFLKTEYKLMYLFEDINSLNIVQQ